MNHAHRPGGWGESDINFHRSSKLITHILFITFKQLKLNHIFDSFTQTGGCQWGGGCDLREPPLRGRGGDGATKAEADTPRVPALRPGMTGRGHAVRVTSSLSSFSK